MWDLTRGWGHFKKNMVLFFSFKFFFTLFLYFILLLFLGFTLFLSKGMNTSLVIACSMSSDRYSLLGEPWSFLYPQKHLTKLRSAWSDVSLANYQLKTGSDVINLASGFIHHRGGEGVDVPSSALSTASPTKCSQRTEAQGGRGRVTPFHTL